MELNCMIIDDEPLAVKLLESYVEKTPELNMISSYTNPLEAIVVIKEKRPHLLFLDIQMPDINGLELAQMVPEDTRVVFTTAFKEYAFDSYEVNALDFLLKPVSYDRFILAVEKAQQWFSNKMEKNNSFYVNNIDYTQEVKFSPETMFIKVEGVYRQINIDNIKYICGMKDYVMFYLESEKKPLVTYLRLKQVEDMLPKEKFMRVNRSYIVSLDKIEKVGRNGCIYVRDEVIHVTELFQESFYKFIQRHQVKG